MAKKARGKGPTIKMRPYGTRRKGNSKSKRMLYANGEIVIARDGREHPVHPTVIRRGKPIKKDGYCVRGHDKYIFGVRSDGACLECTRDRKKKRKNALKIAGTDMRRVDHYKPICPKGHDKRIVGVDGGYCCKACKQEIGTEYHRERRRKIRLKEMGVADAAYLPRLKEIRLSLGMNTRKFAALVGIGTRTLSELENGRRRAYTQTQKKILDAVAPILAERKRRDENRRRLAGAV